MFLINKSISHHTNQVATDKLNSHQDQPNTPHIYTLENLIQTLEEAANYLGLAEKVRV
jgi:hypothetical protein